jgi:hypothetical protein
MKKNKWAGWSKRPPPAQAQPQRPDVATRALTGAMVITTVLQLEKGDITPDYPAHVLAAAEREGEWVKVFWAGMRERLVHEQQLPIVAAEQLIREHWDQYVAQYIAQSGAQQ